MGWPGGGFKVATVSSLNPICIELEFGLSMKTTGEIFISELLFSLGLGQNQSFRFGPKQNTKMRFKLMA